MGKKNRNISNHQSKSSKHSSKDSSSSSSDNNQAKFQLNFDGKHVVLTIVLFLVSCYLYYNHMTYMFENDKHFSHLSNLERELSFRTEMGLYYSYYKTIIEAPSFLSGIKEITNDNVTEYPSVINTLQRFNLYPEVLTALLYRNYRTVTDLLKITTVQCWQVTRGKDQAPVVSCEGSGDPMYFYVGVVYSLNALMMGVFYLFGATLAETYHGGVLAVAAYFFNQGECTRVQWTPALRESFAHPFLILQMWITSVIVRGERPSTCLAVLNGLSSLIFILFWQFAPFALTTQIIAVAAVYVLDLVNRDVFNAFIKGQAVALLASYLLLFGNKMLLSSLMTSCLIAAYLLVNTEPIMRRIQLNVVRWFVCLCHFMLMIVCFKVVLTTVLKVEDDAHITDLLRSKFSDFTTFHTKLYTCAVEFDFLRSEAYLGLLKTLLLPCAILSVLITLFKLIRYVFGKAEPDAAVVYNVLQLFAFTVMAALIMRLKAFWTPQLCLVASLLASPKLIPLKSTTFRQALVGVLVAGMCVQGWKNLETQWAIKGEFAHPTMEELVNWINQTTKPNDVFAGSMPIMATVKLTTKRPIVNHPHYEDAGLRTRTKKVYSIFGRRPLRDVHQNLADLKVDYVVVDKHWCTSRSSGGCSLAEIWDLEEPEFHDRNPACVEMSEKPTPYFSPIRSNAMFRLYRVNKFPDK